MKKALQDRLREIWKERKEQQTLLEKQTEQAWKDYYRQEIKILNARESELYFIQELLNLKV